MEITSTVAATFDAQHRIPGYDPCSRPHGHSWIIEVSIGGDLDPKTGWVRGAERLDEALTNWTRGLRGDLSDLLPGVVTSPLGIATAALETMALRFPHISSVRVICSDGSRGEVRRTPRQL